MENSEDRTYVSRNSGEYRAFARACAKGLEDPVKYGPTSIKFILVLMQVEGMEEAGLLKAWTTFANAHP